MTFDPTPEQRRQVESMSGIGTPLDDMAAMLRITSTVLRRVFKAELAMGRVKADLKVSQALYQKAAQGNAAAAQALEARRSRPPTPGTRKGNGKGHGTSVWGDANGAGAPVRAPFEVGNLLGRGGDQTAKSRAREELADRMLQVLVTIADDSPDHKARAAAADKVLDRVIGKVPQKNINENSGPDGGPLEVAVIRRVIVDPRNQDP